MTIRKFFKRLWHRLYPKSTRNEAWEKKWNNDGNNLSFSIKDNIPADLQAAVTDGWFPAGTRILDIGCGSGELSLWLASQGYQVLGVDFAPSAISRARASSSASNQVAFETLDICRATPGTAPFPALFDRGCLHTIPDEHTRAYEAHVAEASALGAHFLLLHKLITPGNRNSHATLESMRAETIKFLTDLFAAHFEILSIADTLLERTGSRAQHASVPGLALRLERK